MFARMLIAIILAAGIGVGLLSLRQQRLEIMNEMTAEHRKVDKIRRNIWDVQVRIAEKAKPSEVERVIKKSELAFEPVVGALDQRTAEAPAPITNY
ncbi:hypothetical protein JD969_16785 [Planctomycetota bacterium]|nr:hypothetical protein JD969_16785 [Planctomycetota bacterium]